MNLANRACRVILYKGTGFLLMLFLAVIANSAAAVDIQFDIDPTRSSLTASAKLLNNTVTVVEQKSGSLVSVVDGLLLADFTGSTFTFGGLSSIDPPLHPQTPFQPAGSGEDNYAGKFTVPFVGNGTLAARAIAITILSGSATENGPANGLVFRFTSGHLDVVSNICGTCSGSIDMTVPERSTATNASTSSVLSQIAGNTHTITIPVDITSTFQAANPNDSSFRLQGQIVAVRELTPPTLDGDFNLDGTVDAADYIKWRHNGGLLADYNLWRSHFGQTQQLGAGSMNPAVVPEPASLVFVLVAILVATGLGRRHGTHIP